MLEFTLKSNMIKELINILGFQNEELKLLIS